jgi:adenylyltransferase/sulfurtransferase
VPTDLQRYARQLALPEFGEDAQRRLAVARVLSIGAGGLGSPVLLYLAAAGVGTLGVIDADTVATSNLHRQVIHGEPDIGRPKTASAADALTRLNPRVQVIEHEHELAAANANEIIGAYDLVVDGSDNFPTRYLVNDVCVATGVPWVWGSILGFAGQVSVFWPGDPANGPCYRCVYPEPPPAGTIPSCAEGGVIGSLPGVIGTIQATEAIKVLTGVGEPLVGRLLLHDAWRGTFRTIDVRKDAACTTCGAAADDPAKEPLPVTSPTAGDDPIAAATITVHDLAAMRDRGEDFVLVDVREPYEREIVSIDGAVPMPMREFADGTALAKLPADKPVVLFCHAGSRSARALGVTQAAGLDNVRHVAGGITAWAQEIETDKPTY